MSNWDAYIGTLIDKTAEEIETILRGGEGSGHHAPCHEGRPGEVGGSKPCDEKSGETDGASKDGTDRPEGDYVYVEQEGLVPRGEKGWMVDRDGNVLMYSDRGRPLEEKMEDHVVLPIISEQADWSNNYEGLVAIHTHPNETWPSDGDWALFGWQHTYTQRVVLSNGNVVTLEAPKEWIQGNTERKGTFPSIGEFRDVWMKYENEIFEEKWDDTGMSR